MTPAMALVGCGPEAPPPPPPLPVPADEVLYDFPAGDGTPDGFIVRFASPLAR